VKERQRDEENTTNALIAVRENKMGALKSSDQSNLPLGTLSLLCSKKDIHPRETPATKLGSKTVLVSEL
jgi:hypothetical protein